MAFILTLAILIVQLTLVFDAIFVGKMQTKIAKMMHSDSPRIAIVTSYYGKADFRSLTHRNFADYSRRHGYDLIVVEDVFPGIVDKLPDSHDALATLKYTALQHCLLGPSQLNYTVYDYAMWADADTLFLNHRTSISAIVDSRFDVTVSTGMPDDLEYGWLVDSRHMIFKNSANSHEILRDLIKLARENCGQFLVDHPGAGHALNGWLHVCNTDGMFWNSDAGMLVALYSFRPADYRCRFKKVHHRIMNSQFPGYEDGDLAVAFPDHMIGSRKRLIQEFLACTDFGKGRVDRSKTDKLDPVDPGIGDWRTLDRLFGLQSNFACSEE